ncbi:MAG: GntR family transcriptional regulator [Gemmatimonadaceae bacterium]
MARERRRGIAVALRERVLQALATGALREGDRLPPSRELAVELGADPRVIAHAYRDLAEDGLVEIRRRSGVFIATLPGGRRSHGEPPASWLADLLAEGVLRGVAAPQLAGWLQAATARRQLSAVVVAEMADQVDGLAHELREHYGLDARGVLLSSLAPGEALPRALRRANLIITTAAYEPRISALAQRLARPYIVACMRSDLLGGEWLHLMRRMAYVVIADPRFGDIIRDFIRGAPGEDNVRVLLAGRDDLSVIPPDAPTYITQSARERLGRTRLPGRLVTPARLLSDDCVRRITRFIAERNLATERAPFEREPARIPTPPLSAATARA